MPCSMALLLLSKCRPRAGHVPGTNTVAKLSQHSAKGTWTGFRQQAPLPTQIQPPADWWLTRWGLEGRPGPEAGWEARALFFWGVSLAMSPLLPAAAFCRGALGRLGRATRSPLACMPHTTRVPSACFANTTESPACRPYRPCSQLCF